MIAAASGARIASDGRTLVPPRGLPEQLPPGERRLWQGAPGWRALARRAFHVRGLAAYFGVLLAWSAMSSLADGTPAAEAALFTALMVPVALVPILLLTLYAWLVGRSTTYTLTNRRVVIRLGLALPMTINLPFSQVEAASMRLNGDGSGDVCLRLHASNRIAYLVLWPHARPWRLARSEPMLRAVPDAVRVGELLAEALADSLAASSKPVKPAMAPVLDAPVLDAPVLDEAHPRAAVAA